MVLLIFSAASFALADEFGQGDYSTDGTGPCYTGTACEQSHPWNPNPSLIDAETTWYQCLSHSGPVSWKNTHGKCLYHDPRGDWFSVDPLVTVNFTFNKRNIMKNLICLAALVGAFSIPSLSFAASQIMTCKPLSCNPYRANGSSGPGPLCDYEMGTTFVFELTGQPADPKDTGNPNQAVNVTSGDSSGSFTMKMWDLAGDNGHNIWQDGQDSFKAYLPALAKGGKGKGTIMQFTSNAVIDFVLVSIDCSSN